MTGSIKLINDRRPRLVLDGLSRWQVEASLWGGLLVIGWELTPLRSLFIGAIPPFAEWIAVGLAGVAMVTAIQVKRRLGQRLAAEEADKTIKAPNPLSLVQLLREFGVRELGSLYLYMPMPKQDRHHAAWAWIDTLQAEGLIKGDPWPIKADRVKETVKKSHDHLFVDDTQQFDVYRLDQEALIEILGDELP